MRVLLDVMGGDNAPAELVKGGLEAAQAYAGAQIVMIGDETAIRSCAAENGLDLTGANIEIVHASQVIDMEDNALSVIREKTDSSMAVGLRMLAEGQGDVFVSAGNTGALHAGSTLIVRRIRGIRRSAIASVLPFERPTLLIDSGANVEVDPVHLQQFGMIGSIYMNKLFGIPEPAVGLLNNGTEPEKGGKLQREAHALMEKDENIRFVGNVEGKAALFGVCDVLVTDGYTGNIFLKTVEGVSVFMMKKVKGVLTRNPLTMLSSLPMKRGLQELKNSFDASEYGGAPLLGLTKPVIKTHGSSDAREVKNAIRQAINFAETGVIAEIARRLKKQEENRFDATPSEDSAVQD